MLVLDSLDMLVTSDPVAEIDAALARTVTALRAARSTSDSEVADRLAAWIDHRLDERFEFAGAQGAGIGSRSRSDGD